MRIALAVERPPPLVTRRGSVAPLPSDSSHQRVACILGLPIDVVDMRETVRRVHEAARTRTPLFLSTPNLNFAMTAMKDDAFRDSLIQSDLCIADGMPLLWVARLLGVPLPERVAGSALLEALRRESPEAPLKVYFFGGPDGVAEAAARRLNQEPCGLRCVGWESPGMGTAEELSRPESIARIRESRADFVVVSLGAKKGQAWIQRNRAELGVPVVSHLGAALNFVAGTVSRAPRWVQRSGMEWLWRIKEEPALWRRYFADGRAFIRVMATRVLPLSFALRSAPLAGLSELRAEERGDELVVRLPSGSGHPPSMETLGRLARLLRDAARARRRLRIEGADAGFRRSVQLAGASYLLECVHGERPGLAALADPNAARAPR